MKLTITPQMRAAIALGICLALVPMLGHAQTADSLTQWFMATYGRGLMNLGIIVLAILCLCMRLHAGAVICVASAGLLLANKDQLAGMFGF